MQCGIFEDFLVLWRRFVDDVGGKRVPFLPVDSSVSIGIILLVEQSGQFKVVIVRLGEHVFSLIDIEPFIFDLQIVHVLSSIQIAVLVGVIAIEVKIDVFLESLLGLIVQN
jgi:hypothetical protein